MRHKSNIKMVQKRVRDLKEGDMIRTVNLYRTSIATITNIHIGKVPANLEYKGKQIMTDQASLSLKNTDGNYMGTKCLHPDTMIEVII